MKKRSASSIITEKIIREQITTSILGGQAFSPFEEIVADFPESSRNILIPNGDYTPWHLLEHIRRTQQDILNFLISPSYTSLSWPKDYWPPKNKKATKKEWNKTISDYKKDLLAFVRIIGDETMILSDDVKNGDGETY